MGENRGVGPLVVIPTLKPKIRGKARKTKKSGLFRRRKAARA